MWKEKDRAKLMDSIIRNYPFPAIFLYRNQRDGDVVYDVIDGKQRIESFLMFSQISRMKHVELVCELMLSIQKGDPINKKSALNNIMADTGVDMRQVGRGARLTIAALNRVRRMFPKLYSTRFFVKVTDFYTLTTLIAKFEQEGLILTDRRRNRLAWDILSVFSNKVDARRRRGQGVREPRVLTCTVMTFGQTCRLQPTRRRSICESDEFATSARGDG